MAMAAKLGFAQKGSGIGIFCGGRGGCLGALPAGRHSAGKSRISPDLADLFA
jgi:hypothetical protein